jgi:hypothetical protein
MAKGTSSLSAASGSAVVVDASRLVRGAEIVCPIQRAATTTTFAFGASCPSLPRAQGKALGTDNVITCEGKRH